MKREREFEGVRTLNRSGTACILLSIHRYEAENKEGENSTEPGDVYTSPKQRTHINFSDELKSPFPL